MTTYYWATGLPIENPDEPEVLVILPEDAAARLLGYWAAIPCSTWGELRQKVPAEVASLLLDYVEESEPMYGHTEDSDMFDMSLVSGWEEAAWPPWARGLMADTLPKSFLERFATVEASVHDGFFATIPATRREEAVAWLQENGNTVEQSTDLALVFTDPALRLPEGSPGRAWIDKRDSADAA